MLLTDRPHKALYWHQSPKQNCTYGSFRVKSTKFQKVPRLCVSDFVHIYTKWTYTCPELTQKLFEKWLFPWTKVGKNFEENLRFLLSDQFVNVHSSIIFLDWALKFGLWFDNTYQFALVETHTAEYFVCIYAKPLNIGKFLWILKKFEYLPHHKRRQFLFYFHEFLSINSWLWWLYTP